MADISILGAGEPPSLGDPPGSGQTLGRSLLADLALADMSRDGRYMADKLEVLNLLRPRGDGWTSPAQIRAIIHVPDRTLRNWFRDLVKEGAVELRGERKGRRYRFVERPVVVVPASGTINVEGQPPAVAVRPIFTAESQALIKRVEAPLYTRPPATYREDWLQTYVPNESTYLTPKREELAALGKRDPINGHAGTYIKKSGRSERQLVISTTCQGALVAIGTTKHIRARPTPENSRKPGL